MRDHLAAGPAIDRPHHAVAEVGRGPGDAGAGIPGPGVPDADVPGPGGAAGVLLDREVDPWQYRRLAPPGTGLPVAASLLQVGRPHDLGPLPGRRRWPVHQWLEQRNLVQHIGEHRGEAAERGTAALGDPQDADGKPGLQADHGTAGHPVDDHVTLDAQFGRLPLPVGGEPRGELLGLVAKRGLPPA